MRDTAERLAEAYHRGARELVESLGGSLLRAGGRDQGHSPFAEYAMMTDGGAATVTAYEDWTAVRFARPHLGRSVAPCGRNGKWDINAPSGSDMAAVRLSLQELALRLEGAGARSPARVETRVDAAFVDSADVETLRDREALGERFVIVGFDKEEAAREIASQATDGEGRNPAWLRAANERHVLAQGDFEAYVSLREWRAGTLPAQAADRDREARPSPFMRG